jgi:hypothetical protein
MFPQLANTESSFSAIGLSRRLKSAELCQPLELLSWKRVRSCLSVSPRPSSTHATRDTNNSQRVWPLASLNRFFSRKPSLPFFTLLPRMRLIDVETYQIREFFGDKIPNYAILSHTWGTEEVTFQDMAGLDAGRSAFHGRDDFHHQISSKQGYKKIMHTCKEAIKDKLGWAWVDTCCIDKSSSSELSEAINSMFEWYRRSSVCYGYLSDIAAWQPRSALDSHKESLLKPSRWFTRGWTLQELIAPRRMKFFGRDWRFLGSRRDLGTFISNITRIPIGLIDGEGYFGSSLSLDDFSVAQKMSWAATRQCTRIEDSAYCLLGIFDINMPLLYGEGEKAFRRLQEEIFKGTDDHSLLAWTIKLDQVGWKLGSVFADSPHNFLHSCDIIRLHEEVGAPSLVTKKGLQISLPLEEGSPLATNYYRKHCRSQTFQAILNCGTRSSGRINRIVLLVVKDYGGDQGIKQSQCYSRLLTRQNLGLQDEEYFQTSLGHKTIFLRTFRHKFHRWSPPIEPPTPVHIHVHNNQQDRNIPAFLRYTGKIVTYLMDGIAVHTDFDADNIIVQGDCFNLRMMLHSGAGMSLRHPLQARCGLQQTREGRGYVQLYLQSEPERRPFQSKQDFQFVKLDDFSGDLMSVSLRVGHSIYTISVHCKRSWDEDPGNDDGLKLEQRVHLHIHFSCRSDLLRLPGKDLTELSYRTWRATDFFSIFKRTMSFLAWEKAKQE